MNKNARSKSSRAYQPSMSPEEIKKIKNWHKRRYDEIKVRKETSITYMGRTFLASPQVYPPRHTSHLLGEAVLAEVNKTDRVLDMGTGSGVNAVLAASKSSNVIAVDVNPEAVKCAKRNAKLNKVDSKVKAMVSDVFQNVKGRFDLIIFDPPFRWFVPKDMLERSIADEDYETLTCFFNEVKQYLTKDGRVLLFFGSTGDIKYLDKLIKTAGFKKKILAKNTETIKHDWDISQYVHKLTLT